MKSPMISSLLVWLVCLGTFARVHQPAAGESNWPQFRGPNGSGVAIQQKPPVTFGKATNCLWSVPVPSAASSPVIWDDRIVLTGFSENRLRTLCSSRTDGRLLWERVAPVERLEQYHPQEGSPAASTAVTDGTRIYVYFGSSGLVCYDWQGVEQWRYSLPTADTFGGFGTGTSPVLAGDLVIVTRNQADGPSLEAVDAKTGKRVWNKKGGRLFGWSTPVVWDHGGGKEIVVLVSFSVISYDLQTGAERWTVRGIAPSTCATPVVGSGRLFVSSWSPIDASNAPPPFDSFLKTMDKDGDGVLDLAEVKGSELEQMFQGLDTNHDARLIQDEYEATRSLLLKSRNVLVAIKPGGRGDCAETHVEWSQSKGLPFVSSPLLYQERLYLIKDGGLASCYDAATGHPVFLLERLGAEGSYYASPVAADGRIYGASLRGIVVVFEAGDSLKVLARNDLGERISATPAIVEDTLYVRTAERLCAFKSRPSPAEEELAR